MIPPLIAEAPSQSEPALLVKAFYTPLDKHPAAKQHERRAVYSGGMHVELAVSLKGAERVAGSLRELIVSHQYKPGRIASLGYALAGQEGAGSPPRLFNLDLFGATAGSGRWVYTDKVVVAQSQNLLDAPGLRESVALSATPLLIKGVILTHEVGLYELTIRLSVRLATGEQSWSSSPVFIYQQ
jgi:hypothetical protein